MNTFEFYLNYEYWFAVVQLVTAMLGLGALSTLGDFRAITRAPRSFSVAIFTQMLLVPLIGALYIGFLLGRADPVAVGVLIGLAIAVAIPGGSLSNILTLLARGNIALSIAITGVTTLACILITPIVIQFLVRDYLPGDFVMPAGQIAREIFLFLLIPLFAGMIVHRYANPVAQTLSKWSIRVSLFFILLIVIGALGSGRVDLADFGIDNILITFGLYFLVSFAGLLVPFLCGTSRDDMVAIQIEVMMRNVNLGVLIAVSLFPAATNGPGSLGSQVFSAILFYGGCQIVTGFGIVALLRFVITEQRYGAIAAKIGYHHLNTDSA